jgi:AcrR family transcriptional regulator
MTSSEAIEGRAPGLRERKKAKTRAAIQQEAMRLFRERGYDGATVEDIAEAAEVSPSTFFRYFPTKEDVVLRDDYDELMMEAFLAQPPDLTPLQAARAAMHGIAAILDGLSPEERELEQVRATLTFSVPEVRAHWFEESARVFRRFAEGVAVRTGRAPDDMRVRTAVGAVVGVILVAMEPLMEDPTRPWTDFLPAMDEALSYLEQGLPL